MRPVKFKGCNVVYAKNQSEYNPLPSHKTADGAVTSCWRMGLGERLLVLITGRVYLKLLTFNRPLQPQRISVRNPVDPRYDE